MSHGFQAGDTIADAQNASHTAVVHHIDPACNNVYVYQETGELPTRVREINPELWVKADTIGPEITTSAYDLLEASYIEVTVLENRRGDGSGYSATFVGRQVARDRGAKGYEATIKDAVKAILKARGGVTGNYIVVALFWDGDVQEFDVEVKPPLPPEPQVEFAPVTA